MTAATTHQTDADDPREGATDMTDFRHRAACRDQDPEMFFPLTDVGPGARQVDRAKAVCAVCPVRAECLVFALENGLDHGIYGGLTERERRAVKSRQAASRKRTA